MMYLNDLSTDSSFKNLNVSVVMKDAIIVMVSGKLFNK